MIFRLIYVSRGRNFDRHGLHVMGASAAVQNERTGITGALLLRDGWFIQLLEGDRAAVLKTLLRIDRDPRHSELRVVLSEDFARRLFPACWMALIESGALVDRVFAKVFGTSGFDPRRHTSEDFLRLFEALSAADLVALDAELDDVALV